MEPDVHQKLVDARLKALEAEVRRLRTALGWPPEEPVSPEELATVAPLPGAEVPIRTPPRLSTPAPSAAATPRTRHRARPTQDIERWIGENALLAIGLVALVATAGFLLKYAFEQGWISPAFRVIAGLAAGIALALYGGRQQRRGLADFGGALVGGGGAIAYVSIWAAAGPYQFIPASIGIACLAAVSGMVILSAWASKTQYLAALAAVGAFTAPIVLGDPDAPPEILVLYCLAVGATCGYLALRSAWPFTFGLVAVGFYGLVTFGAWDADPALLTGSFVAATAGGLWLTRARDWNGPLTLVFFLGWLVLAANGNHVQGLSAWLALFTLPLVVATSWLDFLRGRGAGEDAAGDPRGSPIRTLRFESWGFFALSALGWAGASVAGAPELLAEAPLALLGAISLPYLWLARRRSVPGAALVGLAVLAWGIERQLDGVSATAGWAALAILATGLTRPSALAAARWGSLLLGLLAASRLVDTDLAARATSAPAFTDPWSLVLYLVVAGFALPAGPLWGEPAAEKAEPVSTYLRRALWIGAGTMLLAGGTLEIGFVFEAQRAGGRELAHDLTVSAFWLVYAGALLAYGFRFDRRGVRVAGLVVTGLAILKIAVHDLTQLEALYRVGALGLLAAIALLAARAYHRRRDPPPGGEHHADVS